MLACKCLRHPRPILLLPLTSRPVLYLMQKVMSRRQTCAVAGMESRMTVVAEQDFEILNGPVVVRLVLKNVVLEGADLENDH